LRILNSIVQLAHEPILATQRYKGVSAIGNCVTFVTGQRRVWVPRRFPDRLSQGGAKSDYVGPGGSRRRQWPLRTDATARCGLGRAIALDLDWRWLSRCPTQASPPRSVRVGGRSGRIRCLARAGV